MDTVRSLNYYQIALLRIVMRQRPFVVVDLDQHTHVLLPLNIWTGLLSGIYICFIFKLVMICWKRNKPFTHSSVAYISASDELRVVIFYRLETQWTEPFYTIMKPEIERVVNNGSLTGFCGSGRL